MTNQDRREQMRRLLARRDREGLTFAELAGRSGIPVGTLAWWSSRLRSEREDREAGFVELKAPAEAAAPSEGSDRLEVVLGSGRRVLVPAGFDAAELQRLVLALDS
jgi:transcriptional regulator with XRE-family HTH domain